MPEMVPGSNVPLTREVPGLTGVVLGTSWDAGPERELEDNLVMAAILCDATGKALSAPCPRRCTGSRWCSTSTTARDDGAPWGN